MPKNRLKSGISGGAAQNSAPPGGVVGGGGFVRFTVFVVTLAKASVKFMGIR